MLCGGKHPERRRLYVFEDRHLGDQGQMDRTEDGDFLKTLRVKEYSQVQGFWTILHSIMENDQKDHKTIMEYKDVEINTGISDAYFTERMMTRGLSPIIKS